MSRFNQRPAALAPEAIEKSFQTFRSFMRNLALPVLAVIVALLAFLWWRPIQRWALGIDELERRIEALERKR